MIRALSSRRWSERAIRPSGPTGCCGLPLRSPAKRLINRGRSGGVAAVQLLGLRVELGLPLGQIALPGFELELRLGARGVRRVVVVIVHQPLGLGLEDAQGTAAATGELGELR